MCSGCICDPGDCFTSALGRSLPGSSAFGSTYTVVCTPSLRVICFFTSLLRSPSSSRSSDSCTSRSNNSASIICVPLGPALSFVTLYLEPRAINSSFSVLSSSPITALTYAACVPLGTCRRTIACPSVERCCIHDIAESCLRLVDMKPGSSCILPIAVSSSLRRTPRYAITDCLSELFARALSKCATIAGVSPARNALLMS